MRARQQRGDASWWRVSSRPSCGERRLCGAFETLPGDARTNADAWRGIGGALDEVTAAERLEAFDIALSRAGCVVDALYGTGLDRELVGLPRAVIERLNGAGVWTCALDIPSGIDANDGSLHGVAVRADLTVTFAHYKLGLLTSAASAFTGRLAVAHIGVPETIGSEPERSAELLETTDVALRFSRRARDAHKASAGRCSPSRLARQDWRCAVGRTRRAPAGSGLVRSRRQAASSR